MNPTAPSYALMQKISVPPRPQALLDTLAHRDVTGAVSRWWNDNFDRCYVAYEASTNQMPLIADAMVARMLDAIDAMPSAQPIRLASFACGDGEMDAFLLDRLVVARPQRVFHFLGIDISESLCEAARLRLQDKVAQVELQVQDITQLKPGSLPDSDIAYIVHGHYYMPDLEGLVDSLLNARGAHTHFAIVSAPRAPYNQAYSTFWQADRQHAFWHSDYLLPVLKTRGIEPSATRLVGKIDLKRAFDEGFETRYAKDILNFLCHVDLDEFDAPVKASVVGYLESICDGDRQLDHICDLLWIAG